MLRIPNFGGIDGCSSTFTLPNLILPVYLVDSSSTIGAIFRQGAHHVAQKSTKTGILDFSTSVSKLLSVITIMSNLFTNDCLSTELHGDNLSRLFLKPNELYADFALFCPNPLHQFGERRPLSIHQNRHPKNLPGADHRQPRENSQRRNCR